MTFIFNGQRVNAQHQLIPGLSSAANGRLAEDERDHGDTEKIKESQGDKTGRRWLKEWMNRKG